MGPTGLLDHWGSDRDSWEVEIELSGGPEEEDEDKEWLEHLYLIVSIRLERLGN